MPSHTDLRRLAARVGQNLRASHLHLATAESCTGGWIAKAITDIPGSSEWFLGGFVTYSNAMKMNSLGVRRRWLERYGAVSKPVAREMARGALRASGADVAVAVTGIAGPDGGSPDKPVGTVWFCWALQRGRAVRFLTLKRRFSGNRAQVRSKAVALALRGVRTKF